MDKQTRPIKHFLQAAGGEDVTAIKVKEQSVDFYRSSILTVRSLQTLGEQSSLFSCWTASAAQTQQIL